MAAELIIKDWSAAAVVSLQNAESSICLWAKGALDIHVLQLLLNQLENGVKVELAIPAGRLEHLDITRQYWEHFKDQGGILHAYQGKSDRQFYVLIDDQHLLLEHKPNLRHRYIDLQESDQHLQKCRKHFLEIKNAAHFVSGKQQESVGHFDAPQIRFWLGKNYVEIDETFELHWEVLGAQEVEIDQGIGTVPSSGRKLLSARRDTTFHIKAANRWDVAEAMVEIQVNPAPKIKYHLCTFDHRTNEEIELRAIPDFPHRYAIVRGQMLRLYWEALNTHTCHIEGTPQKGLQGFVDLAPEQLSIFTIIAEGDYGTARQPIIMNVFSADGLAHLWETKPDETLLQTAVPEAEVLETKSPDWWEQKHVEAETQRPTTSQKEKRAWGSVTTFLKRYFTNG